MTDVRPITYLKNNAAELIREVAEGHRAVTITQNGEAKAVVMDVEQYEQWRSALAMLKILAQSESEVAARRTLTQDEAFARAEAALQRALRDG
jgi:prevent-host-death family protein